MIIQSNKDRKIERKQYSKLRLNLDQKRLGFTMNVDGKPPYNESFLKGLGIDSGNIIKHKVRQYGINHMRFFGYPTAKQQNLISNDVCLRSIAWWWSGGRFCLDIS